MILSLLLPLSGCTILSPEGCTSNAECEMAFGWGHTCVEGACNVLQPSELCSGAWPADVWSERAAYSDAVVLGTIIGDAFPLEQQAIRLAVEQVNDLGGIDERPVVALECDPGDVTDEARQQDLADIVSFLSDGAGARSIVGPVFGSDAVALPAGDTIYVSPSVSAIGLADSEAELWRVVPSDADLSQAIIRDMIDEGLSSAVVVYSRAAGQSDLALQIEADLKKAAADGLAVRGAPLGFESDTERDARVVEAAYANAEVVVVLAETLDDYVATLLAASAIEEYQDLVLYLGPAAFNQELLIQAEAASALFPNIRGVRSAIRQGAVADVFRASFSSRYDGADPNDAPFAGQAYDAAWAALSASLWSGMRYGSLTPEGVSEGMSVLSFGNPLSLGPSGWNGLIEEFTGANPVDLDGASSPLDFDLETRAIRGPMAIWVLQEGDFTTVQEYVF